MRFGALFISALIVLGFSMPGFAQPFAYITNVIDDTVSLIDTATNTVIDTINVGDRPVAFGLFITQGSERGPNPIPTMSEWGFIIFAALIVLSGVWYLRRRNPAGA